MARGLRWWHVVVIVTVPFFLLAAVLLLAFHFGSPPEGPPLASFDVVSGQPFEERFDGSGASPRVWLDMECTGCSFPVEGTIVIAAGGRTLTSVEIEAGDSRDRAWGGHDRRLQDHPLTSADAAPSGAEMTVSGTLVVRGPRTSLTGAYVADAPPPQVRLLRLTVTD